MSKLVQRAMHCPCGNPTILVLGLCATCYTLKRQDDEYFWRPSRSCLREGWLSAPRVRCFRPGETLDHRSPPSEGEISFGIHDLLCLSCHAKVHRRRTVVSKKLLPHFFSCYRESNILFGCSAHSAALCGRRREHGDARRSGPVNVSPQRGHAW
jgi:hypothetical protein